LGFELTRVLQRHLRGQTLGVMVVVMVLMGVEMGLMATELGLVETMVVVVEVERTLAIDVRMMVPVLMAVAVVALAVVAVAVVAVAGGQEDGHLQWVIF
jgi:hypothetical protein